MLKITCIVRPHKLEEVKTAIAWFDISGMSVSDVRGRGNSPERPTLFAGEEIVVALPLKSKIVIVVADELVEPIIEAIREAAHTGEPGDGKVFVEPMLDALRVRTGERGETAI